MKLAAAFFFNVALSNSGNDQKFFVAKGCEEIVTEMSAANPIHNGRWVCKSKGKKDINWMCKGRCDMRIGNSKVFVGKRARISANCMSHKPMPNVKTGGLDEPPRCVDKDNGCAGLLGELEDKIQNATFRADGKLQCDDGRVIAKFSCGRDSRGEPAEIKKMWDVSGPGGIEANQACSKPCYYRDVPKMFPLTNGEWICKGPRSSRIGALRQKRIRCEARCDTIKRTKKLN